MAQTMVNFRMDEELKAGMEQTCKEMGMSMTTAFTIFATKVSREKRIPFEVAVTPHKRIVDDLNTSKTDRRAGYVGRTANSVADEMERIIQEAELGSI